VLVVDDQFAQQRRDGSTVDIAQGVLDQIHRVTNKPIRYVVNTHHHADHAGGNLTFGKVATIVAQKNERRNLIAARDGLLSRAPAQIARTEKDLAAARGSDRSRVTALEEQLAAQRLQLKLAQSPDFERTLPSLTYDNELQIRLGTEEIRLYHFGPAHTDGDTLVYFVNANVAHWGDTFETKSHPFIDRSAGASTRGWIEFLERGLQTVAPTARMIPGHGTVGGADDVRAVIRYFSDLRGAVAEEIKAGRTKDETIASVVARFPQYKDFRPGEARFRLSIGVIYDELK
jgi:glyoxylase-like metal-dependent hydrolase (beta-lactamase superfamily II)